ncbi:restriction endonuclease subunit S [Mammaliicoccus sciuri]|uniref:restriction endonuclease subunit S n=1 Tax=Mammaliicoccus sciuri TaxID=1296 RepID=UPI002DC01513|nr:restriction endonuclease subunit S [Mammaliicoccus sciuri]MEB5759913.1 restriction endonuclease subunit S [Mammaliicoccus sciuri]
MTSEVKRVPELRFPEFDGEWEELRIGQLAEIIRGSSPRPISDPKWFDNKSEIGWLRISDVTKQNGRITNLDQRISVDGQNKTRVLHNEHLLLSIAATVGKPVINYVKTGVHDGFLIFLNPLFDIEYMFQWLDAFRPKWKKYGQPGSQVNLNSELVRSQKIVIPDTVEQKRIAELFSKLDRQIELEEQKLAKLEEQKNGYMQKIFSQQLRFKDENGNDYPKWENKQLGNLVDITMGQSPSSKNYTENSNYTTLVQGNADLNNGYIEPRIYTKQITKLAEVNDILLTVRAPVGKIGRAQLKACIGRGVCAIKGDSFIYYFLELFDLQNKWIRFSQGSTFESISGNEIKNIDIAYPVNEERQKISEFLSKLDKLLKNQLLKVEQLKQRKQGLLQKMFI